MTKSHLISACEAARRLEISNAAVSNALKSGRLPYVEKTKNGYQIDPDVLEKVFADSPGLAAKRRRKSRVVERSEIEELRLAKVSLEGEIKTLRVELDLERKRADAAEVDRDAWRKLNLSLSAGKDT